MRYEITKVINIEKIAEIIAILLGVKLVRNDIEYSLKVQEFKDLRII